MKSFGFFLFFFFFLDSILVAFIGIAASGCYGLNKCQDFFGFCFFGVCFFTNVLEIWLLSQC